MIIKCMILDVITKFVCLIFVTNYCQYDDSCLKCINIHSAPTHKPTHVSKMCVKWVLIVILFNRNYHTAQLIYHFLYPLDPHYKVSGKDRLSPDCLILRIVEVFKSDLTEWIKNLDPFGSLVAGCWCNVVAVKQNCNLQGFSVFCCIVFIQSSFNLASMFNLTLIWSWPYVLLWY